MHTSLPSAATITDPTLPLRNCQTRVLATAAASRQSRQHCAGSQRHMDCANEVMLRISMRPLIIACALVLVGNTLVTSQELPAPEAWAALERGDASKASAIFRDALDRSPDNAILHYGIANASLGLGRTDAAIASLKKAIEKNPRFVEAMVLLARVAYGAADLDLAVRSLEKAAAILPRDRQLAGQLATWKKESELHQSFQTRPGVR